MFDGLILIFGGQLIHDTNFQILLMGKVFPCLFIVQPRWYPECLIISWVRLVMWDTWSITVDLRHGSRTAKRLVAGGPSRGGGPSPWPRHKAFGLRGDGGVLAWELRKSYGGGQINHFLRLKNNTQGICHAEFSISAQVWQIKVHGCDLNYMFHYVSMFQTLNTSATNQENHYNPPTCRLFWQDVYNRYQPFQFFKGQMWDPAQSDQKFQIQWTFETTCLPLMSTHVWSFLLPEFQEAHPITKVDP